MSLTREEAKALLDQSMVQLAGDPRFQAFFGLIEDSREAAILDLCNDAVVSDPRLTLAAIGEIRAWQHLIDTYREVRANRAVSPDEQV